MADLELNSIGNGDGNNYLLRDNSKIPLSGSNQISGSLIPATDNSIDIGSSTNNIKLVYAYKIVAVDELCLVHANDAKTTMVSGGTDSTSARLILAGKDYSYLNRNGYFFLQANDGTNLSALQGTPSGTLSWSGSLFQTANLNLKDTAPKISLFNNSASSATSFIADTGQSNYSNLEFNLWNSYTYSKFVLFPSSFFSTSGATLGRGSDLWGQIYSTNATISTSDERQKDNIKQIDDKLLNAWENVNIVQFNFKDALEKKGENARLHTGYIAQNIQQACEEKGVNPNDYGLFCFDSWEEQEEKKDENGQVIEPYRAKGDLYSLRYEEALVVECAYLRRENAKLKEQLQRHEDYLKLVEEHLHLKNL